MTAVEEKLEVTTISDLLGAVAPDQAVPFMNDLYYGEPGAGKTHLLGTVLDHPDLWPILIADIDGGVATLRNWPKGTVEVVQVREMSKLEEIHKLLSNDNHAIDCPLKDETAIDCPCGGYYKSFGIDTGTEMQKLDMKVVMNEEKERATNPEKIDKLVPTQKAWHKSNERIRMIVRAFRDLPIHFFMTCHAVEVKNEKTGTSTWYPSLPGKLKGEIPGFFNVVGYLRAVEERKDDEVKVIRILQLVKTDSVIAKDRTNALGDLVRNPNLSQMWSTIQETNVHK